MAIMNKSIRFLVMKKVQQAITCKDYQIIKSIFNSSFSFKTLMVNPYCLTGVPAATIRSVVDGKTAIDVKPGRQPGCRDQKYKKLFESQSPAADEDKLLK